MNLRTNKDFKINNFFRETKKSFSTQMFSNLVINLINILIPVYLILIFIHGINPEQRLTINELGFLVILLIFNSGIIENLTKIKVGDFELYNTKIDANLEVNRREGAALSFLGKKSLDQKDKKTFYQILVTAEEIKILDNLSNDSTSYVYEKYMATDLRHLIVLKFIESPPKHKVSHLQKGDDLKKIYTLTEWGQDCINSMQEAKS